MKTKQHKAENSTNYQRFMRSLAHRYMKDKKVDRFDPDDVANWAIDLGLWVDRKRYSPSKKCARDLRRALATEYIVDPQGREVRNMVAYPVETDGGQHVWEWAPLYNARRDEFHLSQQLGRGAILSRVRQHKLKHESWNDNNKSGATLAGFDYNFNMDLEEESLPTEYPDTEPQVSG